VDDGEEIAVVYLNQASWSKRCDGSENLAGRARTSLDRPRVESSFIQPSPCCRAFVTPPPASLGDNLRCLLSTLNLSVFWKMIIK